MLRGVEQLLEGSHWALMLSDSQEPSLGTMCIFCSVSCLSKAGPYRMPLTVCGVGWNIPAAGGWQGMEIRVQMQQCPYSRAMTVSPFCAEALAFSCFTELMKRMNQNFPHGGAMDTHFANMRSLIQVRGSWHSDGSLSNQRGKAVLGVVSQRG